MSSPLTYRHSMGKWTANRRRRMVSRISRTASGSFSAGRAYSISLKRTKRGVANSRWLSPTSSTVGTPRADRRLMEGHSRGKRRAVSERSQKDRKSTRLNSSHVKRSYAVFCLKKKTKEIQPTQHKLGTCE